MRVLVTGANGGLGRYLVRRLLDEDVDIVAVARDASAHRWPSGPRVLPVSCDIGQMANVRRLAASTGSVDVVFHLAAATSGSHADAMRGTVVGSRNLVEAFGGTGARFVLVSSFSVYKMSVLRKWAVLDETTPIEDNLRLRDSYTITKTRQELLVRDECARRGLPLVIIRPGKIYAPDTVTLPPQLGLKVPGVVYLWMGGTHVLPLTNVSNCADAICLAGLRDAAVGETLNIVDDDLPTQKAFMRLYRECCGPMPGAMRIPDWMFTLFVWTMERANRTTKGNVPPVLSRYRAANMWKPLRYSNQHAKDVLDWRPTIGWREGVRAMLSAMSGTTPQAR